RIFRTFSWLMRLAVIFATQPFSKRMRTLAMSSRLLRMGTPTASTCVHGERTRCRMISRSWIITSSTTPTSRLRPGYGERRRAARAARGTRKKARPLENLGRRQPPPQRRNRGFEALDGAALQDDPPPLREVAKFPRLLGRLGEGLFHEHMLAGLQQRLGDFK